MTSIAELSDSPLFTIRNVSKQTGILPVTLRAWERRHGILAPHRSGNRYRLYSERDIALLRWLKIQVDNGISISSAARELHSMIKNGIWPEAAPGLPAEEGRGIPRLNIRAYTALMYESLIRHDEIQAGEVLNEVLNGYDLATVFSDILAPVLTRIGDAWYRGEIRITTEHFASTLLRGKLLTLMQAYPSRRGGAHILVGCAPDEQHEIGSLMLSVLLRVEGYRVEFLGPDLPLDDLSDYAASENPDMIILSAIMHDSAVELIKFPSRLDLMKSRTVFGYGGSAFISHPELHTSIRGEYLGDNYREAVATTTRLVKELNASRKNS